MQDEFDDEPTEEQARAAQLKRTLLIVLGILVVLGVVVAVGTTLMVRTLGLDENTAAGPVGSSSGPPRALPTTALPVPGQSEVPTDEPTDLVSPTAPKNGTIQLNVSPVLARPMERINLTGTYAGQDNLPLKVQRFENGQWSDFGVAATVRVGTFETYVMTGREGDNRFRVFDETTNKGSNVVLVTID